MKPAIFSNFQVPERWLEYECNSQLMEIWDTGYYSAKRYYEELQRLRNSLSFENGSTFFTENFGNSIEFFDILENTMVKKEILKVLEYCYTNITTCGALVRIAQAILGKDIKISLFLEEVPIRIIFDGVVGFNSMYLTTTDGRFLTTKDGRRLIGSNVRVTQETIPVLKAFFLNFVPPEEHVVFEFI